MTTIQSIVAGIDFSKASTAAVKEAHRISRHDNAALVALHVLDQENLHALAEHTSIVFENVVAEASGRLDRWLTEILGTGHGVTGKIVIGHAFQDLREEAERQNADLVVVGSHGIGDSPNRVGATAGRCIRKLRQNVLVVRGRHGQRFRKVVACIDFSEHAAKAARHAAHFAHRDGAALELFHALPTDPSQAALGIPTLNIPLTDAHYTETAARAREKLEALAGGLVEHGIACSFRVTRRASIHAAIAETHGAPDSDTDLIVLSTRGRTGLKWLLLGTVAEKIIAHSPCSVLVVKPDGFDYRTG